MCALRKDRSDLIPLIVTIIVAVVGAAGILSDDLRIGQRFTGWRHAENDHSRGGVEGRRHRNSFRYEPIEDVFRTGGAENSDVDREGCLTPCQRWAVASSRGFQSRSIRVRPIQALFRRRVVQSGSGLPRSRACAS